MASGTLKSNETHKWDKNKFSSLSFDWVDARNPGTGKVSVTVGDEVASYSVPQANIAVDKQSGKLRNDTDKTIKYTLKEASSRDRDDMDAPDTELSISERNQILMADAIDAGQGTRYVLTFKNNSSNLGNACVYQTPPPSSPNVMSLAWFSKMAHPSTTVRFEWTIDYSFVWSETGKLEAGVLFTASQIWNANLTTLNQVTFTKEDDAFTFKNLTTGPNEGSLLIKETALIPKNQASVGIGMSGSGTFVQQAQPNWNLTFTPHPQYWITFGTFVKGEVLDIQSISNPAQIQFPANVYSMTAILNEDNSWTVEPTSQTNARISAARAYNPRASFGDIPRL